MKRFECAEKLRHAAGVLARSALRLLAASNSRMEDLGGRLAAGAHRAGLDREKSDLQRIAGLIPLAARRLLEGETLEMRHREEKARLLDPLQVVRRGYALLYRHDGGGIVKDARSVAAGDLLDARMRDGRFLTRVEPESEGDDDDREEERQLEIW